MFQKNIYTIYWSMRKLVYQLRITSAIIVNDENQLAVKNIWNEKLKEVQLVIVEKINNGTCLYTHPHTAQLQGG